MEIDYINGLKTTKIFGMSKYQKEIHDKLKNVKLNVIEYTSIIQVPKWTHKAISPPTYQGHTLAASSLCNNGLFNTILNIGGRTCRTIDKYQYLYLVKKNVKEGNVKHITYQELAYLLKLTKLEKAIVTCYDIIPWIYDKDRSPHWRLNMTGLEKADRIITCAEYSKNDIIKYLGYQEDRIHVIYPAIDHNLYYKRRDKEILRQYSITEDQRVVLYVGSETPRQNVPLLIQAFEKLKKKMVPKVKLLKIGRSQQKGAREKLLKLVQELNLQKDVIFIDYVPEEELPKFYNAADLYVYPGLYAGVSMPCLEAMACGTPVISCPISIAMEKISFLPEDTCDAGMLINPYNTDELAKAMYEVLTNDDLRENMSKKGLGRAKMLSWDKAAKETLKVYEEVYYGD